MKTPRYIQHLATPPTGRAGCRLPRYSPALPALIIFLGVVAVAGMAQAGPMMATGGGADLQAPALTLESGRESVSLLATIFKATGALVLVVGLMLLFLYLVKKIGLSRGRFKPNSLIRMLDIYALAPKKHVAVLEVAGEVIVVGVTEQQISMLTRLEKDRVLTGPAKPEEKAAASLPSFAAVFGNALNRFKKDPTPDK